MAERNLFDNELRSRFEGFEPEPPAGVWFSVQEAIAVPPQKSMLPVFFRVAAAIAFLAISGISVWFITGVDDASGPLAGSDIQNGPAISSQHSGPASSINEPAQEANKETVTARASLAGIQSVQTYQPAIAQLTPVSHDIAYVQYTSPKSVGIAAFHIHQGRSVTPRQNTMPYKPDMISSLAFASSEGRISGAKGKSSGITLGLHVSPQYNDRHISSAGSQTSSGIPFGSFEEQTVSYGYGITATVPVFSRLSIQAGLSYKNMAQVINDISAFSRVDQKPFYDVDFAPPGNGHPQNIITSFGIIETNNPGLYFSDMESTRVLMSNDKLPFDVPQDSKLLSLEGRSLTQAFSFIEVPLVFRYRLFENRFIGLHLKAGMAGNFLVNNDVIMSYLHNKSEVIGQTAGVRNFSLSGIGGVALSLPVTNRIKLFLEPTAQMFVQPIVAGTAATSSGKTYPYCFAVYSGISFRF